VAQNIATCHTPRLNEFLHIIHVPGTRETCCDILHCVAVCCIVLQCGVVCCSVLQCAVWCRALLYRAGTRETCCDVLQCVAVCCGVLQCVAVCCSVLQCVAVCCSLVYGSLVHVRDFIAMSHMNKSRFSYVPHMNESWHTLYENESCI